MSALPILRLCEGVGARAAGVRYQESTRYSGDCHMCGGRFPLRADWTLPKHERDDMLARVRRGDFG
jgi:hypothetical protein